MSAFNVIKSIMQISRCTLLACVTATVLLPIASLPAKDTEAQTKARQALEQKLNELSGTNTAPVQAPDVPVAMQPTAAPAPVVFAPPGQQKTSAAATSKALDDALRQKMAELQAEQPPAAEPPKTAGPAPVAKPAAAPPAAPAAVQPPPTPATTVWPEYTETPANGNDEAIQKALHQKMTETKELQAAPAPKRKKPAPASPAFAPVPAEVSTPATPTAAVPAPPVPAKIIPPVQPVPPAVPPPVAQPAPVEKAEWGNVLIPPAASPDQLEKTEKALQQAMSGIAEKKQIDREEQAKAKEAAKSAPQAPPKVQSVNHSKLPPLPTPPAAVSVSKEQRLQDLLQQYTADKISAEQYHSQRAKILAEP
jgi:hypothetical protein